MRKYQRLQDLREDRDLKQEDVASVLGITRQQYQLYESGKREIRFFQVIKLAEFYNVSVDYIAGLTNCPDAFRRISRKTPSENE